MEKGNKMEGNQTIVLKNLPLTTRNYQIVDSATGKPIENTSYSLTIAPHVIESLYELKRINEEKKQQALFREQYVEHSLTNAYTPTDNTAFAMQGGDQYIDIRDVQRHDDTPADSDEVSIPKKSQLETMQSDTILGRVTARQEAPEKKEITLEQEKPELDYITADTYKPTANYDYAQPVAETPINYEKEDNSVFNPESSANYSMPNTPIPQNNNKQEKQPKKGKKEKKQRKRVGHIDLERDEVRSGRGIAWMAYILFFLPLIFKGKNRFVRIHANEGLDLNIAELVGALLVLPFFLVSNPTGILEIVIYVAGILGLVVLCACALTIIPMMLLSMCGAQFQIPWLLKKRIIKVEE